MNELCTPTQNGSVYVKETSVLILIQYTLLLTSQRIPKDLSRGRQSLL